MDRRTDSVPSFVNHVCARANISERASKRERELGVKILSLCDTSNIVPVATLHAHTERSIHSKDSHSKAGFHSAKAPVKGRVDDGNAKGKGKGRWGQEGNSQSLRLSVGPDRPYTPQNPSHILSV